MFQYIYPKTLCFADLKEFWGRGDGNGYKEDKTIKPFKISYSAEVGTLSLSPRTSSLLIFMNIY